MRSGRASSVAANPVLIGAVTVLVTVTAVFLAYNANSGLPFVPVFEMKVEAPNGSRLVVGNEVREGGYRVGQVSEIETVRDREGGPVGALLTLRLDKSITPLPEDTTFSIRPRSALGLKFVEMRRGEAPVEMTEGETVQMRQGAIPPELDDLFNVFDEKTREAIQVNLATFGGGFAGRGVSINRTLAALPELLRDIQPVMRTLSAEETQLARFFDELALAARVTRPVADSLSAGFTYGANTFEALSRDPEALKATISGSPPTLAAGLRSLPVQRRLFTRLADISPDLSAAAQQVRTSLPAVNSALAAGIPVLPRTVRFNEDLETAFTALRELSESPSTNLVLEGLTATMRTLTPTLQYVGPHITVCNGFNYFFTFLADAVSEEDQRTGTLLRIQGKSAPEQDNTPVAFGASFPANAENVVQPTVPVLGDPAILHAQPYGRAVDEQGNADCENLIRAYPTRFSTGEDLAPGYPEKYKFVISPRTPGSQGPVKVGRERVPQGQTFAPEPTGDAPPVVIR